MLVGDKMIRNMFKDDWPKSELAKTLEVLFISIEILKSLLDCGFVEQEISQVGNRYLISSFHVIRFLCVRDTDIFLGFR